MFAPTNTRLAKTNWLLVLHSCFFPLGNTHENTKDPPGFLLDAIPPGVTSRRFAGLFLWIHVVVSYAINSQAICGSMDQLQLSQMDFFQAWSDPQWWMLLSGVLAVTAFLVANAIPFFQDLVSLIGALTSVPLTLLLPAVFFRKTCLSLMRTSIASGVRVVVGFLFCASLSSKLVENVLHTMNLFLK